MAPYKQSRTQTNFGSRYLSNLKSELIRNNLVTRTDLIKLYQPPLKKGEDQSKNPFISNAFFVNSGSQMAETMDNSDQTRYGLKAYMTQQTKKIERQHQQHNSAVDGVAFGLGI